MGGPARGRELTLSGAYFTRVADGLQPVPEARSPWADDMLHGRFLAGLAARAVESIEHDPALRLARLTVDMFRSPPMTPFTVATSVTRDGRRVRVVAASISCGDIEVARATALMLRTADEPAGKVWRETTWDAPPPESVPRPPEMGELLGGWDIRLMTPGGFWTAERKRLWSRDVWQLVEGEEPSPAVRAALASDLPNPLANSSDEGLQYINPDLTMFLARPPVSGWVGLEVANHIASDGIAVGSCTLYDIDGPIGSSTVCGLVNDASLSG